MCCFAPAEGIHSRLKKWLDSKLETTCNVRAESKHLSLEFLVSHARVEHLTHQTLWRLNRFTTCFEPVHGLQTGPHTPRVGVDKEEL